MPKLYHKKRGGFYTKSVNSSGQVITLQIDEDGAAWLQDSGFEVGDELGSAFWDLWENNWLTTLGHASGGGDVDIPITWIQHEALARSPVESELVPDEPLTIPCSSEFANVPRFLFAPNRSIYYTILNVENSSYWWLQVPLLIKHRGAQELLNLGAVIGEEFTEAVCGCYSSGDEATWMKTDFHNAPSLPELH